MQTGNLTIYTIEQVASLFGVTGETVRVWAREGRIPVKKLGKRWFFEEKSILKFLNEKGGKNERS